MERLEILNGDQIQKKIDRLTYEIYEDTVNEKSIILAGIAGTGYAFSERIFNCLKNISDQEIQHIKISLEKDDPLSNAIDLGIDPSKLEGATVILLDDVVNSGRTMIYAAAEILRNKVRVLKTAVLVDRRHRRYPIKSDFVGLEVSTTLQNHIAVDFESKEAKAFLE
ncbi:MAG: phosphoribosyltransferase family protein [Crocinitomicaceae bacterium]|nr:phosphoribosyltransferase [Crocinitomicaceae bacterium]